MKYRGGNYTIFKGEICKLYVQRQELPLSKFDNTYVVCYEADEKLDFEGFTKHPFENLWCRSFGYGEIGNAFHAQTYGLFNKLKVKVFKGQSDLSAVNIIPAEHPGDCVDLFLDMGTHFAMETTLENLKEVWEERKVSEYDFPFPDGVEKYIVMKIV